MKFGLDKGATLNIRRGQPVAEHENLTHMCGEKIHSLSPDETHKYLGMQLLSVKTMDVSRSVQEKVRARVKKVCKTHLYGRNKVTAVNTWAIPVTPYTFGVLDWSPTALQDFDRKLRSTLKKYRMLYPRSSLQRLYSFRKDRGRGSCLYKLRLTRLGSP